MKKEYTIIHYFPYSESSNEDELLNHLKKEWKIISANATEQIIVYVLEK